VKEEDNFPEPSIDVEGVCNSPSSSMWSSVLPPPNTVVTPWLDTPEIGFTFTEQIMGAAAFAAAMYASLA